MKEKYMSLMGHLEDLRKVLIRCILSLVPTTVVGWIIRDQVLDALIKPVKEINPEFKLSILGVVSPFFVYLKIAMAVGFILSFPYIIYQIWSFVLPALREKEIKALRTIVPASVLLFFGGVAFAYFTVFQIGVQFFWNFALSSNLNAIYSMDDYLSFSLGFLIPFGLVFEMPIVVLVLAKMGIVSPKFLATRRKYAMLIIFIIAAVLTPGPDVISQLMMAAPMYILYEISILLSYLVYKQRQENVDVLEEETEGRDNITGGLGNTDEVKLINDPTENEVKKLSDAEIKSFDSLIDQPDLGESDIYSEYIDNHSAVEQVEHQSEAVEGEQLSENSADSSEQNNFEAEYDSDISGEERLKAVLDDIQKRGEPSQDDSK